MNNREVNKKENKEKLKGNIGKINNEVEEQEKKEELKIDIENKQIKWILIIGTLVILGTIATFWAIHESNSFEYGGFNFRKENFGKIPIYKTRITGYTIEGNLIDFNLALRNDPRKSKVPVEGEIKILREKDIYFSFNLSERNCGDGYVYVALGMFISSLGFNPVSSIANSAEKANELKRPFITCENTIDRTVFIITPGEETRIKRSEENQNCYIVSYKDCESLEAIEKLEMEILLGLKKI
ncbi:MAG: hypothetical protein QXJ28_02035 [Candidatus Pacearchaeota archaeon]